MRNRPGNPKPVSAAGSSSVWIRWLVAAVPLLLWLEPALAESRPYFLRNHSPFLHIFGLPAPEGGVLTPPHQLRGEVAFSLANHADSSEVDDESVVLDGETYYTDLVLRYGLSERWEVGIDVPYVAHRHGRLDNLIEGWHDLFGFSNDARSGPSNHLEIAYRRNGTSELELRHGTGGLGDIRVAAAYRLLTVPDSGTAVALRSTLKLPTGNATQLEGSGATDIAMSLDASHSASLLGRPTDLFAQAGALWLGDGDVLPEQQEDVVPFGALGLAWHWTNAVELRMQLSLQSDYFDSRVEELGSSTASLAIGGGLRIPRLGIELDLALVEDLFSDTTPDFGAYLSVSRLKPGTR